MADAAVEELLQQPRAAEDAVEAAVVFRAVDAVVAAVAFKAVDAVVAAVAVADVVAEAVAAVAGAVVAAVAAVAGVVVAAESLKVLLSRGNRRSSPKM